MAERSGPRAGGAWRALAWVAVAVGCREAQIHGAPSGPADAGVHPPSAAAVPGVFPGDALWTAAERGDAADLLALARREGAAGLVEVAQREPSWRRTALAALPLAEDVEVALGPLCRWLAAGSPDPALLVRTLHAAVEVLPRDRERLDVWGAKGCLRVLGQLKTSNGLGARDRDVAASAAVLLGAWLDAR